MVNFTKNSLQKNILELQKKVKLLQKENNQLKNLIIIDDLTKLYNRRGFWHFTPLFFIENNNQIQEKRKKQFGQSVLLFIDIDDFKHINDHHGHDKGDQVLKSFAAYLKQKVRKTDLVFRWGGEEFIIVLRNITFKKALEKTQKLLFDINRSSFAKISLTVSIGIIDLKTKINLKQAIKDADKLMYQAKRNGKNTICY